MQLGNPLFYSLLVALLISAIAVVQVEGFSISPNGRPTFESSTRTTGMWVTDNTAATSRGRCVWASSNNNQDPDEKLRLLGFTENRSRDAVPNNNRQQDAPNVLVNEVQIDPFTLVVVGFGLIAFNFLVLGNMGDAGIGGVVATIINWSKEQ